MRQCEKLDRSLDGPSHVCAYDTSPQQPMVVPLPFVLCRARQDAPILALSGAAGEKGAL